MVDAVIIGAGVTGCAIARELSRYDLRICILEKEEDVCCGTSKANSAIVHAGYDAVPGTLKAALNVRGNAMMDVLCRDLDVPFRRTGSLVLCPAPEGEENSEGMAQLKRLMRQGEENGVPGLKILDRRQLRQMEPSLSRQAAAALYAPTAGIICPFTLTAALAENAAENGAQFRFDTKVLAIESDSGIFRIQTDSGDVETRTVINAAGVYADEIHNMVCGKKIHITARKGEYCLLDHAAADLVHHTVFQLPTARGKGVLVTPTVHGNLLIGPTAEDTADKDGLMTTQEGLKTVLEKASASLNSVPKGEIITAFAGLRAHPDGGDFIIGEAADTPGFFDAAGIESPGLSAAPAIGEMVSSAAAQRLNAVRKASFREERKGIPQVHTLPHQERAALIRENPAYGNIICRCEMISEGEILDAIHRTPGARSLDGVKRRTRAGMGRCQSGFCGPRVMEILSRETAVPMAQITKRGGASRMLTGTGKIFRKEA